eukprot:Polyplicarium_translucidae@DN2170_c0_g1_i3.p1
MLGALLKLPTVFTDHSLFGFDDYGGMSLNKACRMSLCNVTRCIAVSYTNKENLCMRAAIPPRNVTVIPNALDAGRFVPAAAEPSRPPVVVVVISRMTYRKGITLLVDVIPLVMARRKDVKFVIGGSGPLLTLLEEMREHHRLYDQVEFLGTVPHDEVCAVLRRGHIFLNCSLTEAFGIALIEAASTGLLVVSTAVGGAPEVLPDDMVRLAEPDADDITEVLLASLDTKVDRLDFHRRVTRMYSWEDVARRTDAVYRRAREDAVTSRLTAVRTILRNAGPVAGKFSVIWHACAWVLLHLSELLSPRGKIDIAPRVFPHGVKER